MNKSYKTVRFNQKGENEILEEDLTLSEAKAASQGEGTSGIDASGNRWFIGYQSM